MRQVAWSAVLLILVGSLGCSSSEPAAVDAGGGDGADAAPPDALGDTPDAAGLADAADLPDAQPPLPDGAPAADAAPPDATWADARPPDPDAAPMATCGDGACGTGEDCGTCAADCGTCFDCCVAQPDVRGCADAAVKACVCAVDPFCCETAWDALCAAEVESASCGTCAAKAGCCASSGAAGCTSAKVEACVCGADAYCCTTAWDSLCVSQVASAGCGTCGDNCTLPFEVGGLPYSDSGDTLMAAADYGYGAGACPGEASGWGSAAPDYAYAFTPATTGLYQATLTPGYDSNLYIVTDCADVDGTCLFADEELGSSASESIQSVLEAGVTYYVIVDGYSNTLATNGGTYTLDIAAVVCTPSCTGKVCGDDGCGGSCGTCGIDQVCSAGACLREGDTCAVAKVIGGTPYVAIGNTTLSTADYGPADGACPGADPGPIGAGSGDDVFSFTPATSGSYTITATTGFSATIYVVTDCANVSGTCVAGHDVASTTSAFAVTMTAGTTYYIVVDGYATGADEGAYTLTVTESICTPACTGKECGPDGCGGTCGTCSLGSDCLAGACVLAGDQCSNAYAVTALPFADAWHTTGYGNDYSFAAGDCPGATSGWGAGSPDYAYILTATSTWYHTITLTPAAGFDSALYVVSDCGDIAGTCLRADEEIGGGVAESVSVWLWTGETVHIIVDGYGNTTAQQGSYTLSVTSP
jgi:hypothetical protein